MKFETNKELLQALLDGRTFLTPGGSKIYFNESGPKLFIFETNQKNEYLDHSWLNEDLTEVKEWYEDIPEQGVLCWVSDVDPNIKNTIVIITGYSEGKEYWFKDERCWWKYATPVTEEEAYKYML